MPPHCADLHLGEGGGERRRWWSGVSEGADIPTMEHIGHIHEKALAEFSTLRRMMENFQRRLERGGEIPHPGTQLAPSANSS